MIRIHAEQIVEIALEAHPHVQLRAIRMLLDEHRVRVLRLREPIELMLGTGGVVGFENDPNLGSRKRETVVGGGDRQIEWFFLRKNSVPKIEPERFFIGCLQSEREVE